MPYTVTGKKYKPYSLTPEQVSTNYGGTSVQAPSDSRSKLQTRKFDSTGWREPSPYTRIVRTPGIWQGSMRLWSCSYNEHSEAVYEGDITSSSPHQRVGVNFDNSYPSVPTSYTYRAEVEALVKLRDLKVQYAVALAELGKSISMIETNLTSVLEAAKAAKRRQWSQVLMHLGIKGHDWRASARSVGGRWLEVNYGWIPLLADIKGAHDDARKGILDVRTRLSVVRDFGTSLSYDDSDTVPVKSGQAQATRITRESGRMGCRVRLDYVLTNDTLRTLSRTGLDDPALVAWELLPFSFMADWIVPLGSWLEAVDAPSGLAFKGGTRTNYVRFQRKQELSYTSAVTGPASNPGLPRQESIALKGFTKVSTTHRSVYLGSPVPVPYVRNPWSGRRALNLAALLAQTLKSFT